MVLGRFSDSFSGPHPSRDDAFRFSIGQNCGDSMAHTVGAVGDIHFGMHADKSLLFGDRRDRENSGDSFASNVAGTRLSVAPVVGATRAAWSIVRLRLPRMSIRDR